MENKDCILMEQVFGFKAIKPIPTFILCKDYVAYEGIDNYYFKDTDSVTKHTLYKKYYKPIFLKDVIGAKNHIPDIIDFEIKPFTVLFYYESDKISDPKSPIAGLICRYKKEMTSIYHLFEWAMENNFPGISIMGFDGSDNTVSLLIKK